MTHDSGPSRQIKQPKVRGSWDDEPETVIRRGSQIFHSLTRTRLPAAYSTYDINVDAISALADRGLIRVQVTPCGRLAVAEALVRMSRIGGRR
jgi:hypothetical protein